MASECHKPRAMCSIAMPITFQNVANTKHVQWGYSCQIHAKSN